MCRELRTTAIIYHAAFIPWPGLALKGLPEYLQSRDNCRADRDEEQPRRPLRGGGRWVPLPQGRRAFGGQQGEGWSAPASRPAPARRQTCLALGGTWHCTKSLSARMKGMAAQVFAWGSVLCWLRGDCRLGEPGEAARVLAPVDPSAAATGSCTQSYNSVFISNRKTWMDSNHPRRENKNPQEFTSTEVYFFRDASRRSLIQRCEDRERRANHMQGQRGSHLQLRTRLSKPRLKNRAWRDAEPQAPASCGACHPIFCCDSCCGEKPNNNDK